jgi:hypothetical protein
VQIAVSSVSLRNSQVDTSFIKNLMYECVPSVREVLDDRTKMEEQTSRTANKPRRLIPVDDDDGCRFSCNVRIVFAHFYQNRNLKKLP